MTNNIVNHFPENKVNGLKKMAVVLNFYSMISLLWIGVTFIFIYGHFNMLLCYIGWIPLIIMAAIDFIFRGFYKCPHCNEYILQINGDIKNKSTTNALKDIIKGNNFTCPYCKTKYKL